MPKSKPTPMNREAVSRITKARTLKQGDPIPANSFISRADATVQRLEAAKKIKILAPKMRGVSPITSRTLRSLTPFVQCPSDTVQVSRPKAAGNIPAKIQRQR